MDEEQTTREEYREDSQATSKQKSGGGIGKVLGIVAVLAVIIGLGVIMSRNSGGPVAVVNGEEISRAEYQERIDQFEESYELEYEAGRAAAPLNDENVQAQIKTLALEGLIDEALVTNAADEAGITVTDEEVDQALEERKALSYSSEEEYQADLQRIGVTEEELRDNIRQELKITKYIHSVTPEEELAVTDEEEQQIRDVYEETVPEEARSDDVEGGISLERFVAGSRAQLENEKLTNAASSVLQDLRNQAEIEILIEVPEVAAPQVDPSTIEPPTEEPPVDEVEAPEDVVTEEVTEDPEVDAATEEEATQ